MKSKVKRRPLGATGEIVSEVSLGAMNIRMLDTEEEGLKVINHTLDLGINMIDTARAYVEKKPDGRFIESEVLVGQAIASRKDLDEPIVIVTKGHGYDSEEFNKALNISLNKLGIKGKHDLKIGENQVKLIYFYHGLTEERWELMKSSGALEKAKALQEQGLFTYLGFSSHNGHEKCIEDAINSGYFQVIELPYNVFEPGLGYLIKLAYDKGIGVVNMKAFGGNGMVSKTAMFEKYCDISPSKRLQFCLASPYISTVDVGCRYVEELDLDVQTSQLETILPEECDALVATAARVAESTSKTCRECTHCLEKFTCPQGLDFPEILGLHTRFKIAEEFDGDITSIKEAYTQLSPQANECIACGLCNEWCEYKLDIPVLLAETEKVLG